MCVSSLTFDVIEYGLSNFTLPIPLHSPFEPHLVDGANKVPTNSPAQSATHHPNISYALLAVMPE